MDKGEGNTIAEIVGELFSKGFILGKTSEKTLFENARLRIKAEDEATAQIKKLIKEKICELHKPCSTPNVRPAEYITHDMALDAEDRSLEGQLYRPEEAEQCGGCKEYRQSQCLFEIDKVIEEM